MPKKEFTAREVMVSQEDLMGRISVIGEQYGSIKEKLEEHDERFDTIEAKLEEHDIKFVIIEEKLKEHGERFDTIDERFDTVDKKLEEQKMLLLGQKTRVEKVEAKLGL